MLTKKENIKWLKLFRPDLTNKQIKEYINYVYKHNNKIKNRQGHHIIPKSYFKYDSNFNKVDFDNLFNNNFAYLTIKQHEKAHILLGEYKNANFLLVHRTESYKEKMKKVREKQNTDKKWLQAVKKSSSKTLKRFWKDKNYRIKMKEVQHNNMINANASIDFQYNKKEKLILDCLYNLMMGKYKIITEELWIKYKLHNTPNYKQLFTKYAYVILKYTSIKITDIKELGYNRKDIIIDRNLTYDFKHWSENMLKSLDKIKLLTFK